MRLDISEPVFQTLTFEDPIGIVPDDHEKEYDAEMIKGLENQAEEDIYFPIPQFRPQGMQFTPKFSNGIHPSAESMMKYTIRLNRNHEPKSLKGYRWSGDEWDGTPFEWKESTSPEDICAFLRPTKNPYAIRGLRERFYELNPFKNNKKPTIAEIEEWNLEVVRHLRRLFGLNTPIKNDARLFLESRWANERHETDMWDKKYTGIVNTGKGPCKKNIEGYNKLCGDSFVPRRNDRELYTEDSPYYNDYSQYPELSEYKRRHSKTTVVTSIDAGLPWSLLLANAIVNHICANGYRGDAEAFIHPKTARTEIGYSLWYIEKAEPATASLRIKFV